MRKGKEKGQKEADLQGRIRALEISPLKPWSRAYSLTPCILIHV